MKCLLVAAPAAVIVCLVALSACSIKEERTVQQPAPVASTVVATPAPSATVYTTPPPATATTVYTR
jgi:hypothetical protein